MWSEGLQRWLDKETKPDEPTTVVRSGETVDELYAALPESEWVFVRGMLVKRIGNPPTAEDILDFQAMVKTRGRGPIPG